MPDRKSLDQLLCPQSVAIVGASSDPRRFGGRPIQYLLEAGFAGKIYPVNPARTEIQGLPCFPTITDLPEAVDCAILALGPEATMSAVDECARKGIGSAILFGAGFAELGEEGEALQGRIVARAREIGMRLLGPNCMGLLNANQRFYGTFASALEEGVPPAGPIGLVSQSGGYGGYVMKHLFLRGLGFASWVTTGNECDVDAGEVMRWMAECDDVKVIVAYLEGTRDGKTLMDALDIARRNGKPVVVMKVGRSAQGRAAAASHTASLAGEDAVYDAIFAKYGVHRAETTDELIDMAYALALRQAPVGRKVGVISISGGIGVQMADYLDDEQLVLAPTPDATKAALRALVPACSPNNPIDMTGLMATNHELMEQSLDASFASGAFDAIIVFTGIAGLAPSMAAPLREALLRAHARHRDKLLIVSTTTSIAERRLYEAAGCLVFEDPSRATAALGALARQSELAGRAAASDEDVSGMPMIAKVGPPLDEAAAKALLRVVGVPFPREELVETAAAASAAAEAIGTPVALKVVSPDIAHKTEVGGVRLGLVGGEQTAAALEEMRTRLCRTVPAARITGFLVSEMVTDGVETIVGVNRDKAFGPVVTFGLGGVAVELLGDVVSRPAPVSLDEAIDMIRAVKSAPLLTGFRGSPPLAIEQLAQVIVGLSRFAVANREAVASVEINPLIIQENNVLALDALIERV